ncbi:MAG TPA: hypothetical protein VLO00_00525 [Cryobacterium sp.]|nr:hypothetical protein [Cryobacterium sp.]
MGALPVLAPTLVLALMRALMLTLILMLMSSSKTQLPLNGKTLRATFAEP